MFPDVALESVVVELVITASSVVSFVDVSPDVELSVVGDELD